MGTTREDIRGWLNEGKKQEATHMIVVVDTFDYEDYPVYVKKGEDVHEKLDEYNGKNMQRVVECYSMKLDLEDQIAEHRSYHTD